ncbi:MAG TPA: glycoside hydrolase family 3 C-terminal domain-containing protein, partial [Pseudoxanthomonas sp.]|nr:glycoside hydrolase family 3 C-terminal domain-containing protein [Pseudoxanthomonas sp.]
RLGLFEAGKPSARPLGGKFELLGAPEHRAVARQAVRESLVLLKNQGGVLPLDPRKTILVAGDGANDVGKQSGGWTLNWQGTGTKRADYPNADTVFEGIQQQVQAAGGKAVLAVDGKYTQKPDVAVVVFGEDPYAEFQGDIAHLLYKPGNDSDLELIKRLKADGIPVVAVFISGRPLWVNREINASDAFVAAWLPGSEGGGIADVLLRKADGSVQHDFKGKLSFSWPRTANQYRNNVGQEGYDPQFAFDYGLTYAANGDLAPLPEESGVSGEQAAGGVYFERGEPAPGLSLLLESADGQSRKVSSVPVALDGEVLQVRGVDHLAQEDARRFVWSGTANGSAVIAADTAMDLSRESNGDVMLVMTIKADALPDGEVWLGAGCGEGCAARVPLRDTLAALPRDKWSRVGVPLKCFAVAGADVAKLDRVWQLETAAAMDVSLARLTLGALNEADHIVECPVK